MATRSRRAWTATSSRRSARGRIVRPSREGVQPAVRAQVCSWIGKRGATSTAPAYSMLMRHLFRWIAGSCPVWGSFSPGPSGPVDDRSHAIADRGKVGSMNDAPFRPIVRTQSDVEQMWRHLIQPLGFSGCSLWMVVIAAAGPGPQIMELAELPLTPEDGDAEAISGVLTRLAAEGTRFAFLRSRPGG